MFSGGTGTADNPYLIATAEDLNDVRLYLSRYFKQINDINLEVYDNFEPIGNFNAPFTGHYDGNNFKITSLNIKRPNQDYIGLFGFTNYAHINNCSVYGDVEGRNYVGGCIGYINQGGNNYITNCIFNGSVQGSECIGGFVGDNNSGHLYQCKAKGQVHGNLIVGGFIGLHTGVLSMIDSCLSECDIIGNREIGGFVGRTSGTSRSDINGCYYIGAITCLVDMAGGFIGRMGYSRIQNCFCKANINDGSINGGFVGYIDADFPTNHATITNCYSASVINSSGLELKGFVGGIISGGRYNITRCCYDYEISMLSDSFATLKTTSEMKQQSTFEDWDFDTVWGIDPNINDGYPYLRWNVPNGDGTIENPFLIWTPEDLDNVRNNLSAHYLQMADIDLSEYENWEPIGGEDYFLGIYNGGNFKITNLNIDRPLEDGIGLFSKLGGVPLTNSRNNYVKNCHISGHIRGRNNVGGLCGSSSFDRYYQEHIFYNCSFKGTVEGRNYVGGLIGLCLNDLECCYTEAVVNGSDYCGGLIGFLSNLSTGGRTHITKQCCSNSNVIGSSRVGGLIGGISDVIIEDCYFVGSVFFDSLYSGYGSGGLIGNIRGFIDEPSILRCYSACSISAPSEFINYGRGLVGRYERGYSVDCYHRAMADDYSTLKTSVELKQQSTFINWNFDTIWGINPAINDGYPFLRWMQPQPSDSNVYVKTSPTTIQRAIKMVVIDTPTTIKEIKKLNIITDTGLK